MSSSSSSSTAASALSSTLSASLTGAGELLASFCGDCCDVWGFFVKKLDIVGCFRFKLGEDGADDCDEGKGMVSPSHTYDVCQLRVSRFSKDKPDVQRLSGLDSRSPRSIHALRVAENSSL